jgi:hypothetical protein
MDAKTVNLLNGEEMNKEFPDTFTHDSVTAAFKKTRSESIR